MNRRALKKNFYHRGAEITDSVLTASGGDVARMELALSKRWLSLVFFLMLLAIGFLAARVVYLNVWKGEEYRLAAEKNSTRYRITPAPRGKIFDYRGLPLVENVPQTDLLLDVSELPEEQTEKDRIIRRIAQTLDLDFREISERIAAAEEGSPIIILSQNISRDRSYAVLEQLSDIEALRLLSTARRRYVDGVIFSHILGYTAPVTAADLESNPDYFLTDQIGRNGVEKSYEDILRGRHGRQGVAVDALGRQVRTVSETPPQPGNDLYLTVDAELQKKLHDSLEQHMRKADSTRAAAVAIDPRNGAVRALVSLPAYDNNLFSGGISREDYRSLLEDPNKPLFNRVVSGVYPPGSTVKPFLAAGALAEGVIDTSTVVNSTGSIRVGRYVFRDWRANGLADVKRAIAVSHDIFFYALGGGYGDIRGLKMEGMKKYYNLFGFGRKTGIDIPGEASGFIPDPQWKKEKFGTPWTIGNDYHASIGQGFVLATPLQVASATVVLANGGTRFKPHLLAYQRDRNGSITSYKPISEPLDPIITPEIIRIVREGMRMTVTEGTGRYLNTLPVPVAGKTGTAQFGDDKRTHSWFTAFAPYENPKLVLTVLVEGQGENSASATIPVVKDVLEWYFTRQSDKKDKLSD